MSTVPAPGAAAARPPSRVHRGGAIGAPVLRMVHGASVRPGCLGRCSASASPVAASGGRAGSRGTGASLVEGFKSVAAAAAAAAVLAGAAASPGLAAEVLDSYEDLCKPDADVAMLVVNEDCRKCERNDDGCLYLKRRVFTKAGRDVVIDQDQYNVQKINDRKSTGNAVWEGALALTEYMESELPEGFFKGKTVAEVGAGPGLSSITAVLLGADRVVATDGDPAVVALEKSNFEKNLSPEDAKKIDSRLLRWGVDNPKKAKGPYDVVIGSDLTYDNECVPALIDTMQRLSGKDSTILLMQQKRAWTDDEREMKQFQYAFNVERIEGPEGSAALKRHPTSYLLKMSNKPGFPPVPKEAMNFEVGLEDDRREWQAFVAPDETAFQFLARTHVEPVWTGIPFVDDAVSLRPGHVLELCGASGSGKTELMTQAAVTCILPKAVGGVSYGGNEGGVVMYDLDGKFDSLRLLQVLDQRLRHARVAQGLPEEGSLLQSEGEGHDLFMACLRRFQLVTCRSSIELLAALKVMPARMEARRGAPTRLLLLDSLGAHYHVDRVCRVGAGAAAGGGGLTLSAVHQALVAELGRLARAHHLVVITARGPVQGYSELAAGAGGLPVGYFGHAYLPSYWNGYVTHQLMLAALPTPVGANAGAPGGPGGPGGGVPQMAALWQMPQHGGPEVFTVTDGLVLVGGT